MKVRLTVLCLFIALPAVAMDWIAPVNGILDLRDYNFSDQSYIKLNGCWEFYWEQLIPPLAFRLPDPPAPTLYAKVPAYWVDYGDQEMRFPGKGYASYRLRILLPRGFNRDIGFDVPVFDSELSMYLNGQEILRSGKPGTSKATSKAGYHPAIFVYRPASDTLDILLYVSNFQHRRGGFWKPMQIGAPGKILQAKAKYRLVAYISLGILISFTLFFFFFHIFYRKDKVTLTFSLVLAGIFIRMMNTDLYPVNYILDLPWIWIIRLEYLGTFLALGAALWYFYRLFPTAHMLWMTRINTLFVVLSALVILVFKADVFAYTMLYLEPAAMLLLLYYSLVCLRSIFKGSRENIFFLAAILIFMAALLNDILVANSIEAVSDRYTVHFALMAFVLIQAVLIIKSWVKVYKDREILMEGIKFMNKNLEDLVEQRTLEIEGRNREINQKNEHIEARNRQLKEALDFKNRVFSIIAHDLKSPVANLVQNSILLDYDLSKEDNIKLINSFRESSRSALSLIENLLVWGRSQGDQLKYNPERFDAVPVLDRIFKLYHEMVAQKGIKLERKSEGNTRVFADRELIEIVFRNLLSNALKYTGKDGAVAVRTKQGKGQKELSFIFRDNGVGISRKKIREILEGKELISTPGTAEEKGTGLGLRLCQDLVKINQGSMRIESREGEGTTVIIGLPVEPPED